jgi:hypothetical protein
MIANDEDIKSIKNGALVFTNGAPFFVLYRTAPLASV